MITSDGDSAEGKSVSAGHGAIGIGDISKVVIQSYPDASATESRRFYWRLNPRKRLKRQVEEAIGQAPNNAMGMLQSLVAESDLRAGDTLKASKLWSRAYYMLGLPAAVLATIAGAAGLASTAGRVPAAIIALVSAGLTTAATFLNSNENKQRDNKLSAAWQELADDVRLAVIQYGQGRRDDDYDPGYAMTRDVVRFNKRKSALLRGDVASVPELPPMK